MKRAAATIEDSSASESDTCSKRPKTCSQLYFANAAPPPMTVTIGQREFELTPAFDTFWRLAAERQTIDEKRRAGHPAP